MDTSWLFKLRWLTLAALCVAFGSALVTPGMLFPEGVWLGLASSVIGLTAVSNIALQRWKPQPQGTGLVMGFLAADVVGLTILLASTGGSINPFTALYFVHIALAAVLLQTRAALFVMGLSLVGFGSLFLVPSPHAMHSDGLSAHLQGMWLAFAISASLISVFVLKLHRDLEKETERSARTEQVAALTTLAASAAHELGSPIGTIALAAEGLEERLEGTDLPAKAWDDIHLIRAEVGRCREVLRSLSHTAGGTVGEGFDRTSMRTLAMEACERLGTESARIEVGGDLEAEVELPRAAVTTCLVSLLQNAIEASPAGTPVELRGEVHGPDGIAFDVSDTGGGMSGAVREHAMDPFFSTKGNGTGLGLFLVRAVAEQLRGKLLFLDRDGQQKRFTVRLELPRTPHHERPQPPVPKGHPA